MVRRRVPEGLATARKGIVVAGIYYYNITCHRVGTSTVNE